MPDAGPAYPVVVRGLRRGWWFQYAPDFGRTLSPTYLGAMPDPEATCNGVLFRLPETGLEALEWREQGYVRTPLDVSQVEPSASSPDLADAEIWYWASASQDLPSVKHPIIQSYVDTCIGGCLEVEEAFPAAKAAGFARQFVETTDDWQEPWINDRLLPWRPSVHEPRAWDIDDLIADVLGDDLFGRIRVPGA